MIGDWFSLEVRCLTDRGETAGLETEELVGGVGAAVLAAKLVGGGRVEGLQGVPHSSNSLHPAAQALWTLTEGLR